MEHSGKLLLELFLMFAGGKVLAEVFERLRQPAVVGELLAGVILGPSLLAVLHPSELTMGLAEIGAIFLLFTVGLARGVINYPLAPIARPKEQEVTSSQ